MARTETVSAYNLAYSPKDEIFDERMGKSFDRHAYSAMKYGDRRATQAFAYDLAGVMIDNVPDLIERDAPPELLVAYKAVPPACFYLSRYCLDLLNEERAQLGNEPGRVVQVYKSRVAMTNYAGATYEQRQEELRSITFSLEGRDITAKDVVVLDDIRITGSAEKTMTELMANRDPHLLLLGYIAIFNAQQAASRPSVENDLNMTVIKDITDLLPFVLQDNFDLNIRTLKMLLKADSQSLESFLSQCPLSLRQEIYRGIVNTGVSFGEHHQSQIAIARAAAQEVVKI